MKNTFAKLQNFLLLSVLLPVVYGCQGSGGSDGSNPSIASLLGGGGTEGGTDATTVVTTTGEQLAQLHQPEPATMLLLGGGLVAMHYLKNKKK